MSSRDHLTAFPPERVEAFSDGVFSIVITLLVIELALPRLRDPQSPGELFETLLSLRSHFESYLVCFLFVGQLWMAHANFFRLLVRTDAVIVWMNLLLLMLVCLQPFLVSVIGEYPDNPGAVVVYGAVFMATSAAFAPMASYARAKGFYNPAVDRVGFKRGMRLVTALGVASVIPLVLAYVSPRLAMFCYGGLIVGYITVQSQFRLQLPGSSRVQ